jgi:hypothetical protein
MTRVPIQGLDRVELSSASTLYVPPAAPSTLDHQLLAEVQASGIKYG